MTVEEIGYNRKVVGERGELYKYGEGLFGAYTVSHRIGSKVARLEGALRRQSGDHEATYSAPEKHYAALAVLLKLPKLATFGRD